MRTPKQKNLLATVILTLASLSMQAAETFVSFTGGDLLLNAQEKVSIYVDNDDERGVALAARNVAADMEKVCGAKGEVSTDASAVIVAGTLGHSQLIDRMAREGKLNGRDLRGRREKYVITLVGQQLVIAGSDRRGTIFGLYELSRQMGVSPWYYWADVPVEHHAHVYINKGVYTDGEPAVRYRGIFLNDEAPCLTTWVKNTFGTNYGDHHFYARVFELILRLKGNFMWPAMWSWAFYADDPENSKTADEMGVIMGTSHHEPMARNHQEYARHRQDWGAWNYATNKERLDRFFREGIERAKNTDDVITIGMRGDGDEAMSEEADTKLLETVVSNQRRIISQVTGRPAKETPQVWALYKEVLDYYDKGMRVPDDVTMLLCDDNWGNVRRVPTAKERQHKGGWGLYYHVDYVGAPRNSKWLNVTPVQNMWEQLTLAYDHGIDRMWILNVGDLKPMEYPIQLFMDMAWEGSRFAKYECGNDVTATGRVYAPMGHLRHFCAQTFGEAQADEAARILNLCCKMNGRSTAEMLDASTYTLEEWPRVVADYERLEAEALRQFVTLRPEQRDAYQQIILFPIQAMGNLHAMYYAHAMNRQLFKEGNPDANRWADRVEQAFRRDSLLCLAYNRDLAGGKWNGMMTQKHIGYKTWNDDFPADRMPDVKRLEERTEGYVFTARDGRVSMEAEHTYSRTDAKSGAQWTVVPHMGRTLSALALMPYTKSADGGALTYKFEVKQVDGKEQALPVHIVVKSTLDYLNKGGLYYSVALDDGEPQTICFNDKLNEKPENIYNIYYPTVARRVVESVVSLPLKGSLEGTHTLTIRPLDPGIVFEKVVVDCGGYSPSFLFGDESPKRYEK